MHIAVYVIDDHEIVFHHSKKFDQKIPSELDQHLAIGQGSY